MLLEAPLRVYPVTHHNRTVQIWKRKGYEFATEEEKRKYTQPKAERLQIHREINKHGKQIAKIEKPHAIEPRSWKEVVEFLKFNAPEILYARKPILYIGAKPRKSWAEINEYNGHFQLAHGRINLKRKITPFGDTK